MPVTISGSGGITTSVLNVSDTLNLPSGTSATRPAVPVPGTLRFNTTDQGLEVFSSGGWNLAGAQLYRFIRYVGGATTNGHHPRCSRLYFIDRNNVRVNIVVFVGDNCADSGTIPGNGSTYVVDLGTSPVTTPIGFGGYSSFGGGTRGASISLQVSNDNVNYTTVRTANFTSNACGFFDYF
jgi:hypothetical protein